MHFQDCNGGYQGHRLSSHYSDETKCLLLEHEGAEYVYMPDFPA